MQELGGMSSTYLGENVERATHLQEVVENEEIAELERLLVGHVLLDDAQRG